MFRTKREKRAYAIGLHRGQKSRLKSSSSQPYTYHQRRDPAVSKGMMADMNAARRYVFAQHRDYDSRRIDREAINVFERMQTDADLRNAVYRIK